MISFEPYDEEFNLVYQPLSTDLSHIPESFLLEVDHQFKELITKIFLEENDVLNFSRENDLYTFFFNNKEILKFSYINMKLISNSYKYPMIQTYNEKIPIVFYYGLLLRQFKYILNKKLDQIRYERRILSGVSIMYESSIVFHLAEEKIPCMITQKNLNLT